MENKDWREEFKIIAELEYSRGIAGESFRVWRMTNLIESLLKSKREEIEGEMEKRRKEITHPQFALYEKGYNKALDDLKPIISNILK